MALIGFFPLFLFVLFERLCELRIRGEVFLEFFSFRLRSEVRFARFRIDDLQYFEGNDGDVLPREEIQDLFAVFRRDERILIAEKCPVRAGYIDFWPSFTGDCAESSGEVFVRMCHL